jgi:hypothetical protein
MDKNLQFDEINKHQLNEMSRFKTLDNKGNKKSKYPLNSNFVALYIKEIQKKNDPILTITEKTRLEKLTIYEDGWPCLDTRKRFLKIKIYINEAA